MNIALVSWQIYLVLSVSLMILEIFAPGFILFPIGAAFLLTSIYAYFVSSIALQLLVFAIGCVLSFYVGQRWIRPLQNARDTLLTNVDAMVGQEGVVEEEINNLHNKGYVRIYGDSWRARSVDDQIMPVETRVIVKQVHSNQIVVERKS